MSAISHIGEAVPIPKIGAGFEKIQRKIDADGVYNIPLDFYHSDCAIGPSVSSSGLRTIENKSLAHFWAGSYLNPDHQKFEPTTSMILGSAAHSLLLGQEDFSAQFIVRPEEAPDGSGPWHGNKKICKAWIVEQSIAGKTVITREMLEKISGMAASLAAHPLIQQGLFSGEAEQSLIWKDRETGIWLKSRPDVLPAAGAIRADLKTCDDASADACRRALETYSLHMQAALVCEAQENIFGWKRRDTDCVLVFVETSAPYAVSIRPICETAIAYGRALNRRALKKLADALSKNDFPAYESDLETVFMSPWVVKKYEEQIKLGLLGDPSNIGNA